MNTIHYIKETPWAGLGTQYIEQPTTSTQIVEEAKLNWTTALIPMKTDLHDHVGNYQAVYREDTNQILGVINKPSPTLVQNIDMFNTFDYLIGQSVDIETTSAFDQNRLIMGAFKVKQQYKILDDEIDHYFVVINDHLKGDGKVSVLNTPVRIVCQNTIETAIHKSFYHLRIPVGNDISLNQSMSKRIISSIDDAIMDLQKKAEDLYSKKTDKIFVEKVLDEFFPYIKADEDSALHSKSNQNIEMLRETFMTDCMDADNLNNFRGTQYQVYQALVDFHQHYVTKIDNAYDLTYRMKKISGIGAETNKAAKFLQIADKLAA